MAERKETGNLYDIWRRCNTDRKLQERFAAAMRIQGKPGEYASIYTPEILYLFRCDAMLGVMSDRARMLAEAMYLIHRAKYRRNSRLPSHYLCIITPEEAALIPTEQLKDYFLISKTPDYDWDLEPVNPDARLIQDLRKAPAVRQAFIYHWQNPAEEKAFLDRLALCRAEEQMTLFSWAARETESGPNREDICTEVPGQEMGSEQEATPDRQTKWKEIYLNRIMGRAVDESRLQLTGEFYTPLPFAEKAMVYLGRVIGPQWWTTGRYRLWDMAAGTGNLEYVLPPEAQRYCYMSTLSDEETEYCRKMFPGATVFQYDYLNDDVDFMEYAGLEAMGIRKKMPAGLQADLENSRLRWIILLNPPCSGERESEKTVTQEILTAELTGISQGREIAGGENPEAEQAERTPGRVITGAGGEKTNQTETENPPISYGKRTWATTTKIQQLMMAEGLGRASRDLSSQFLYRIHRDFAGKEAYLGLLARLGYLTAAHNEGIRDAFFRYRYEKGFLFSSMNFKGCKHKFPYGFLVWNLRYRVPLEEQEIFADMYNRVVEKTGTVQILTGEELPILF